MTEQTIKKGDYVVTTKGYEGFVTSLGTGQLYGLLTVQIGGRNGKALFVTVRTSEACLALVPGYLKLFA